MTIYTPYIHISSNWRTTRTTTHITTPRSDTGGGRGGGGAHALFDSEENDFGLYNSNNNNYNTQDTTNNNDNSNLSFDLNQPNTTSRNQRPLTSSNEVENEEVHTHEHEEDVYIWGTDIKTTRAATDIRHFIDTYTLHTTDFEPFYLKQIERIHNTEIYIININCQHLLQHSMYELYRQLIVYPQDMICIFDRVVEEVYEAMYGSLGKA